MNFYAEKLRDSWGWLPGVGFSKNGGKKHVYQPHARKMVETGMCFFLIHSVWPWQVLPELEWTAMENHLYSLVVVSMLLTVILQSDASVVMWWNITSKQGVGHMHPGHFAKWRFHGSRNRHVTYATKKTALRLLPSTSRGENLHLRRISGGGQRYAHRGSESVPRHLPEHYARRSSWPSNVPELLGVNGGLLGVLGCPGLMWKNTSKKKRENLETVVAFFFEQKLCWSFAEVPHHLRRIPHQTIYSLLRLMVQWKMAVMER